MKLNKKQKASINAILARKDRIEALAIEMVRQQPGAETLEARAFRSAVDEAVRDYQRFLVLRVLHPDKRIRPTAGTDKLWHAHILDTRWYHADCESIFGEYLHHDPRVVDDSQDAAMRELYRETFTPSAWGKPDPVLAPLMLAPDESAAKPKAEKCETCA